MTVAIENELPILVGNSRVARIPFPMSEEDFDLLLETLQLWKRRIVTARTIGIGVSCEPLRIESLPQKWLESLDVRVTWRFQQFIRL